MAEQKTFKYRNQEYVVKQMSNARSFSEVCDVCEEANKDYLKGNVFSCVAVTKSGRTKFNCFGRVGLRTKSYPKRIK